MSEGIAAESAVKTGTTQFRYFVWNKLFLTDKVYRVILIKLSTVVGFGRDGFVKKAIICGSFEWFQNRSLKKKT